MWTIKFATNINNLNLNGIVNIISKEVVCYCTEEQSKPIIEAFTNARIHKELLEGIENLCYDSEGNETDAGFDVIGEYVLNELKIY